MALLWFSLTKCRCVLNYHMLEIPRFVTYLCSVTVALA